MTELIENLCKRHEELIAMADAKAVYENVTKGSVKLAHTEAYYRAKADGVNEAIIMATRVLAK